MRPRGFLSRVDEMEAQHQSKEDEAEGRIGLFPVGRITVLTQSLVCALAIGGSQIDKG